MRMRSNRHALPGKWLRAALAVGLLLLAAATAASAEPKKIVIGQVTLSPYYWPNFVAVEKGLFKAENLDVELVTIDTPTKTAQSLSANALNLAWTPPDGVLLGRQKGAELVIVAGAVEKPMYDLLTQPKYHDVKELKGTTLGVSSLRSGSTLLLHYALRRAGLSFPGDYDVIEAGGTPNRLAALRSGGISAAVLTEPETYLAQDSGLTLLVHLSDLVPDYQFIVIGANSGWAKNNRETLVAYLRVVVKAMRWLHDENNREEAARILSKYLKVAKPEYATRTYDSMFKKLRAMPSDAAVSPKAMDTLVDIMVANRQLPKAVPWKDALDDSFRQQALRQR